MTLARVKTAMRALNMPTSALERADLVLELSKVDAQRARGGGGGAAAAAAASC